MEWLFVSPSVIGNLPIFILDLLIAFYLLSVRHKSVATRWLAAWFFSLTVLALTQIVTNLVYDPLWSFYTNRIAASVAVLISLIPLIQFAYHFLDNTYPIESEIALYITTLISLGLSILFTVESLSTNALMYRFDVFHYETITNFNTTGKIFDTVLPLGYAWSVVVLLRKTIHFSPKRWLGLILPTSRKSKAARAFAMAIMGAVIAVIINRLEAASLVPQGSYTSITLLATFGAVIIYINNSSETTSFLLKLISISLVALLVSLGVVNNIVIGIAERSYDNEHLAQVNHVQSLLSSDSTIGIPPQVVYITVRPNGSGFYPPGYAWLLARVEGFDINNLVRSNTKARTLDIELLKDKLIANDPQLDVERARSSAAATIDQALVPLGTRLYRGIYDPIPQHFIYYAFEQKGSLYEVGYSYLEYRRYIHNITLQLTSLMIAATMLILILFPLFFRSSIINPLNALLDGVRKVNAGKHDVVVPIHYPDEIGFLADLFNGMVREVADREQRLVKAEEYYRSLIENVSDLITLVDQNGVIRYESPSVISLFGYTPEELVGKNVFDYIHSDDHSRVMEDFQATIAESSTAQASAVEMRIKHKDGSWRIIETIARNLLNEPSVQGIIINSRDVTERKHMESLQKEKDAAEEANRAKSRFLASMSHELRTPLNAIIGYSEILTEEAVELGQESLTADLKKIHFSGKNLLGIINDILDFSKIEAGKMPLYLELFDINTLVLETVQTVQPLINKNQNRLVTQTLSAPIEMYSDLMKVRQILYNLISNATKFTSDGEIRLEVSHEAASDGENGEAWITLRVSDTGIGLSEEQIGKLFKPFTQADDSTTRKYGGTGLGLAISRQFCQMLGGEINAIGEIGKGATFIVRLPLNTKQE